MAHPDTHRAQAKSLYKKGLITQKQHDAMMAKIEKMEAEAAPAAVVAAPAAVVATGPGPNPSEGSNNSVSLPAGDPNLTKPQQPPAP